ncbi:MAG: hypothetical protein Q8910_10800, partial [Bacteroidota bacterium]|nr:hypothetical protein [Bacteroidota bacterium]
MKKIFFLLFLIWGVLSTVFSQCTNVLPVFRTFTNDELSPDNPCLKEIPLKTFSAEDVLNRTIKWNNPYNPDITPVAKDFDNLKAGKVPPIGIYPRIFTSPSEFAAIKKRLETTRIGSVLLKLANEELTQMQKGRGVDGKYYELLKTGWKFNAVDPQFPAELANMLTIQGLLAQLYDNKSLIKETATVAANYLKAELKYIESLPVIPGRENLVKEPLYSNGRLAKLFDFTASGMIESDKEAIIKAFANATFGRYSVGMELPHHWRRWNHINMSLAFPLTILAIENEKGYDHRIYDCGLDMINDYLTYGFTAEGMSSEGIGYTFGSFDNDILFMAAAARRGVITPFTNPHFRAIPDWLIYSLSPNPDCLWSSHGDLGTVSDIPWLMMMVMKYFFPEDKKIDYVFANSLYKDVKKLPDVSAFVFCIDPSKTAKEYKGIPPVNMPLTFFSPSRGSLIARDKWDKNGIMFQFDARQDMFYQSHDHCDRGNFFIASNGRIWAIDGWRSSESKYHSVITIDGHGQGYFATPASWINYTDKPEATFGLVDYKYAFDWSWLKTPVSDAMLGKTLAPQWQGGVYENVAKKQLQYHHGQLPQRDPLKKVADYFCGCLETDPRIWTEDTWPMRISNYPVQYAFRTAGLIKGKHPYILIIDDLKKDDAERLYEWAMPMQLDVEVVSIKQLVDVVQQSDPLNLGFNAFSNYHKQGEYDIVLGDKRMKRNMSETDNHIGSDYETGRFMPSKGDPLLLVRVLERTPAEVPDMEPNPRLETFEKLKTEDMHQFYLRSMD